MDKTQRIHEFRDLVDLHDAKFPDSDLFYMIAENKPLINFLTSQGFFTAPASTKYHGTYEGGLYDHSKTVYNRLVELTENNHLTWQRPESPFIVGMFHDLCKHNQYILTEENKEGQKNYHYEFNKSMTLKGHGIKSVILLSHYITLTEEETLCILYHMGAYEKDDWNEFDLAIRKYPNVFWSHAADMLASKVDDV